MNPEEVDQSSKPAAYDPEGRPLYYHPPTADAPEVEKTAPTKVRSHITTRPEKIDGHNFNPGPQFPDRKVVGCMAFPPSSCLG